MIAHWKGIVEEIHFGGNMEVSVSRKEIPYCSPFSQKRRLGLQNDSKSFRTRKTAKNSKLPKLPENCFEPIGKGGWPPISTWIRYFNLLAKVSFGSFK
jgi:hypothetical protein